uniref:Uncharacterized protein n=1 Tax=Oncorhynchus tshawytscha TaxID=74940 RepID=A0AAZ3SN18_ONCTS
MNELHSYSTAVVQGGGTPFAYYGEGQLQLPLLLLTTTTTTTTTTATATPTSAGEAGDGAVAQVSGKYNPGNYIYTLVFTTNRGRSLSAGQPYHVSFNFYPAHMGNELRPLSCRFNGANITSIGAYWVLVYLEKAGNNLWGKIFSKYAHCYF